MLKQNYTWSHLVIVCILRHFWYIIIPIRMGFFNNRGGGGWGWGGYSLSSGLLVLLVPLISFLDLFSLNGFANSFHTTCVAL